MKLNKFEQQIERDWSRNLSQKEQELLKTYLKDFDGEAPVLDDFTDTYTLDEITSDKKEIDRIKQKFDKDPGHHHFYAKILELIMAEFSSSWIQGYLSKASEFDDIKRRTDIILEVETDDGIIRTALDITSSEDNASLKILSILQDIQAGKFGQELKYFSSQIDETKGRINLPRLVIGSHREQIIELARLYIKYKQAPSGEARSSVKRQIDEHRFGKELAEELLIQLRGFISLTLDSKPNPVLNEMKLLQKELEINKKTSPNNFADEAPNRILASIAASLAPTEAA